MPRRDAERDSAAEFGFGIGRACTRKVAVMGELRSETAFDFKHDRLVLFNVGAIHGVRNVIVYAHAGHSLHSDDGFGHGYVGVGIKLMIQHRKIL